MRANPDGDAEHQLHLRYRLAAAAANTYADEGFTAILQDTYLGTHLNVLLDNISHRRAHLVVLAPNASAVQHRDSLFWITAHHRGALVGFVNLLGDGGVHAIIMDTCVAPEAQGLGIGTGLVQHAAKEARRRGCTWLHADYEPHLVAFYEECCGLRPTSAGLLRLT